MSLPEKYQCTNASLPECHNREHPHECGENSAETRMILIEADLAEIKTTLNFLRDTLVKADAVITAVAEQVMPTIEDLKKTPFARMLGVK